MSSAPVVHTNVLAISLYLLGQLSEAQLAKKLDLTLIETRQAVADFLNTALDNAAVPVGRIVTLETRLATANGNITRLQLERQDYLTKITDLVAETHDLRNKLQSALFTNEELLRDLAAERHKLADCARRIAEMEGAQPML